LLKTKYKIDFSNGEIEENLARCRKIRKSDLKSVLSMQGGRNKNKTKTRRIKKNKTLKIKRHAFYGGQKVEYQEIFKNLAIPSFNESIIVNKAAEDDLTKPLLVYNDEFKDATLDVVEMEKLPKYGSHFYYESPAFSQVEESITSVYMKEFALVETPVGEERNILLLNNGECLYNDTIKFDSKLADVTSETMFNLFNEAPPEAIQSKIFYDVDEYGSGGGDEENYGFLEEIPDVKLTENIESEEIFVMNESLENFVLVNDNLSAINVTCNSVSEINGIYYPTPNISSLTKSNIKSENKDLNKKIVYGSENNNYGIILEDDVEGHGETDKYFYSFINKSGSRVGFLKVDLLLDGKIENITDIEFPTIQYKVEDKWEMGDISIISTASGGKSKNNKTRKHIIKNKKNTRSKGKLFNKITLKKRKFKKHRYTPSKK
jgi:hypothetical protein